MSPLARLPLVFDVYSRYFFDHNVLFDEWLFYGGIEAGLIEQEQLLPLLREMSGAAHVDVRPIAGLNCMTIVMAGLCGRDATMLTVPEDAGGHMSSTTVAAHLGIQIAPLPMDGQAVDLDRLAVTLRELRPTAIYLDQSTQLFPLDPLPIREVIDASSPSTHLHVDASHTNGLILGGALPNPLERGASSFGGSTHKTLPGPHKGFFATNDERLAASVGDVAYHLVSHRRPAESIALAITLLEMRDCGGDVYARSTVANAQRFAAALHQRGVRIACEDNGFTRCHQVWVGEPEAGDLTATAKLLYDAGVLVNKLSDLPGFPGPALRMSLAEFTRMGGDFDAVDELVEIFATALAGGNSAALAGRVGELRSRLDRPQYCYAPDQLIEMTEGGPPGTVELVQRLAEAAQRS